MSQFCSNKRKSNLAFAPKTEHMIAPVGQLVSTYGEISVEAPLGSYVRAENGSIVHAQAGSIIQACHGACVIVEGPCIIFRNGGAHIEYKTEALVIDQNSLRRQTQKILLVKKLAEFANKVREFGDDMILIVLPDIHVKTGDNCYILGFNDTIIETGNNSRVLTDHGCVVRSGDGGFLRTGNRCHIYTGDNSRIKCGDFCNVRTGINSRITAGQELNSRRVGAHG